MRFPCPQAGEGAHFRRRCKLDLMAVVMGPGVRRDDVIGRGSQSVQRRSCRIFSCTAAAAVKVGTGLLTTL